jgi:hypothetical protein
MSKDLKKIYEKYHGITFTKSILENAKKQLDDIERQELNENAEECNGSDNGIQKDNEDIDMINKEDNHEIKVNVNI